MKKILSFELAIVVAIFALTACIRLNRESKSNSKNSLDCSRLKTVADVFAYYDDFENLVVPSNVREIEMNIKV